ncbi:MAG TPA: alanine racemase [Syntrophomonadaceae bacterium]|jgi:alanine racemase|nr:alanine racemase [Syntrophomonadaceae bacterium]
MNKWIEISVAAIENNLREVQSRLNAGTKLIAVIKANAYGHGAVETARILYGLGVDYFAVSFLEEALQLREAGIQASLLVFSPVIDETGMRKAVANGLTLTIASESDQRLAEAICLETGQAMKIHMKVDTGLGRFGLNEEQAFAVWEKIKDCRCIELEGIYTHTADPSSSRLAEKQFQRFMQLITRLEQVGASFPIKHIANSTIFLRSPYMHLDAVRIGTLLSGQHPVGNFSERLQLQDPYTFKSRVISIRELPKGTRLGYYGTYRLKKDAQIAVVPVGFHDGLALEVANKPVDMWDMLKKLVKIVLGYIGWPGQEINVTISGVNCAIRGKVFMQMALVEIPLGMKVAIGDEVVVPVRKTLASNDISRVYLDQVGVRCPSKLDT